MERRGNGDQRGNLRFLSGEHQGHCAAHARTENRGFSRAAALNQSVGGSQIIDFTAVSDVFKLAVDSPTYAKSKRNAKIPRSASAVPRSTSFSLFLFDSMP